MRLPQQAEPVNRSAASDERQHEEAIRPQYCACLEVSGTYTWWCTIGRDVVNTTIPCTP
jgi:hypothetical protein